MGVVLGRAKFQPFTPRGTFSNWELNKRRDRKKCAFFNGISVTVRDTA